jgi:hypothetical protein
VVIFAVIRRRKESIKTQRPKNENEFQFDDGLQNYDEIINGNEVNSYEFMNYVIDGYGFGVNDKINQNESKVKEIPNNTV